MEKQKINHSKLELLISINPNRSLEKVFLLFLMTAIRKKCLYMVDS